MCMSCRERAVPSCKSWTGTYRRYAEQWHLCATLVGDTRFAIKLLHSKRLAECSGVAYEISISQQSGTLPILHALARLVGDKLVVPWARKTCNSRQSLIAFQARIALYLHNKLRFSQVSRDSARVTGRIDTVLGGPVARLDLYIPLR